MLTWERYSPKRRRSRDGSPGTAAMGQRAPWWNGSRARRHARAARRRVVEGGGNGSRGAMVERLAGAMPGHHVLLHTAIDGRFPNHHPDPSVPENLEDLRAAVVRERADLGLAFDGDGD